MTKKVVFVLVLASVLAGGVWAQEAQAKKALSVGGGLVLQPSFGSTKPKGGGDEQKSSEFAGGVNGFFDAKYVEVNVSLLFGNYKATEKDDKGTDTTDFYLGVLGKFPIALNPKFALFPFAGFDYRINLGASRDGKSLDDAGKMLNCLAILFGVGVDVDITAKLYFRGEIGFGIGLNSEYEDDTKDFVDSRFKGKLPIKLAVGYRL